VGQCLRACGEFHCRIAVVTHTMIAFQSRTPYPPVNKACGGAATHQEGSVAPYRSPVWRAVLFRHSLPWERSARVFDFWFPPEMGRFRHATNSLLCTGFRFNSRRDRNQPGLCPKLSQLSGQREFQRIFGQLRRAMPVRNLTEKQLQETRDQLARIGLRLRGDQGSAAADEVS
jgi:hypothetical protein